MLYVRSQHVVPLTDPATCGESDELTLVEWNGTLDRSSPIAMLPLSHAGVNRLVWIQRSPEDWVLWIGSASSSNAGTGIRPEMTSSMDLETMQVSAGVCRDAIIVGSSQSAVDLVSVHSSSSFIAIAPSSPTHSSSSSTSIADTPNASKSAEGTESPTPAMCSAPSPTAEETTLPKATTSDRSTSSTAPKRKRSTTPSSAKPSKRRTRAPKPSSASSNKSK